jgi:hypothetical protein
MPFDAAVRKIVSPPRGSDGLFIQPKLRKETDPDRETAEAHNRERLANHFNYADLYTGVARTFDPAGNYRCGECNMDDGAKCLLVTVKRLDEEAGSCKHWEDQYAGDSEMELGLIEPEYAGYAIAENGKGWGCHRCPFASPAHAPDSLGRDLYCGKGECRVDRNACCDLNGLEQVPVNAEGMPKRNDSDGHYQHRYQGGIVRHRDAGGIVDPTQSGIGGIQPSSQAQNPIYQGMIQRYSSLPPEKLQELSGMLGNSPQGQIVQRLLQQKQVMPQQGQQQQPAQQPNAQPAAPQQQYRRGGVTRAGGGPTGIPLSAADPSWSRQAEESASRPASGFLAGSTAGRADLVHTEAPGGSYIVPADVVAGLGEGNSLAGAKVMDMIINSGPHGIPMPQGRAGRGSPPPPRIAASGYQAKGGGVHGHPDKPDTPVALSHGEYFIHPQDVARVFGNGDLRHGHKVLDHWVQLERKRQIKNLVKLPIPVGAKKVA